MLTISDHPLTPSKIIKWSIILVFAVFFFGMSRRTSRLLREISLVFQSSTNPHPSTARQEDFWERTEESACFHIDSVCNWKDGWFYGPNQGGGQNQAADYQPTVLLLGTLLEDIDILEGGWDDLNDFDVDERIQVKISSDSRDLYDEGACSFSPTPYHLVAQSAYNEMMGEFYVRTIRGLNRWMRDYPQGSEDDVQIYVHFVERYDIFEGHRLFLGGLPNNNRFESFVSLMPRRDACRCFRKLIFCGYLMENATTVRSGINSNMLPDSQYITASFKERIFSKIDSDDQKSIVFKPHPLIPNPVTDCRKCRDNAYRILRNDLTKKHSERYHDLDDKIRRYRRQILVDMGLVGNSTIDADGWKFVGFARRKSRRLWLNVDDAMLMCNEAFWKYQVACIIVDVEEAETPEDQLIMHRSLHALIGVHGAQLTQGVLLPPHGYILELLPWIPPYAHGEWVALTDGPTPLGEIFHNTDINHYGYSLNRNSTPLCLHVEVSDENGTRLCLTNEENEQKFNWAARDFIVPVNAIKVFVSAILRHGDEATCDEMRTGAEEGAFVLYNAYCRRSANQSNFVTEHYYH
ncbi:hypothetical protein ACHAW5_009812 [Stephanodiscus triporus]|uniref:Uncharacterized protein n=1 Tax=Stephanodiscus triporus TaxID=2934178 RepID=A0ABD3PM00_9STRA